MLQLMLDDTLKMCASILGFLEFMGDIICFQHFDIGRLILNTYICVIAAKRAELTVISISGRTYWRHSAYFINVERRARYI